MVNQVLVRNIFEEKINAVFQCVYCLLIQHYMHKKPEEEVVKQHFFFARLFTREKTHTHNEK
jgi:hypothetical protein